MNECLAESVEAGAGLAAAFDALLARLGRCVGLAAEDEPQLLRDRGFDVGGVPMVLQLEESSGFVKVFADAGRPDAAAAADVYKALLQHQLYFPAPFQALVGVHPVSDHVVVCACAPLPHDEAGDENFIALLHSCAGIVKFLQEGVPELQAG